MGIIDPSSQGFPEVWFVRKIAAERKISLQKALTLIRKNTFAKNLKRQAEEDSWQNELDTLIDTLNRATHKPHF